MTDRLSPQREAEIAEDLATYHRNHAYPGAFACCSAHLVADVAPALLAELAAVRAERDEARARVDEVERAYTFDTAELKRKYDQLDRALGETIDDRDSTQEVADKLAYAVAPEEVIGEHSSMNDPWTNALDLITPAAEVAKLRAERDEARAQLEKYVGKEPTVAEEMEYINSCLNAVHDLCDEQEKAARLFERPAPEWVEVTRKAASGERANDPSDNRHRIYIDGKGNGWISVCSDEGTEWVVPVQGAAFVEQDVRDVADETGSLREIGRCW